MFEQVFVRVLSENRDRDRDAVHENRNQHKIDEWCLGVESLSSILYNGFYKKIMDFIKNLGGTDGIGSKKVKDC